MKSCLIYFSLIVSALAARSKINPIIGKSPQNKDSAEYFLFIQQELGFALKMNYPCQVRTKEEQMLACHP